MTQFLLQVGVIYGKNDLILVMSIYTAEYYAGLFISSEDKVKMLGRISRSILKEIILLVEQRSVRTIEGLIPIVQETRNKYTRFTFLVNSNVPGIKLKSEGFLDLLEHVYPDIHLNFFKYLKKPC